MLFLLLVFYLNAVLVCVGTTAPKVKHISSVFRSQFVQLHTIKENQSQVIFLTPTKHNYWV